MVPFHLTPDWNLITRTIVPIISQGSPAPGVDHAGGLGDINPSFFLSPAKPGRLIWGIGPTMTFPTASGRTLGAGKWSAGPTGVALVSEGPWWVGGALMNNQWSFAGWGDEGEPAARPAVPQLQLRQGLVRDDRPHHHGELGRRSR